MGVNTGTGTACKELFGFCHAVIVVIAVMLVTRPIPIEIMMEGFPESVKRHRNDSDVSLFKGRDKTGKIYAMLPKEC